MGAQAQIAYTNGTFNGTNGIKPSANWDPQGIVNDFTFTSGNSTFNKIRLEMIDGTTGVGTISTVDTVRVRIYNLGTGTIAGLDYNTSVPVFDTTYTKAGGTFVDTLSGGQAFGRDVEFWDLSNSATNLGAGHFGLFVMLTGHVESTLDCFWGTSTPAVAGDAAAVFGPGLNSAQAAGNNEHAFTMFAPVPEPASMTALALGALALLRKRRNRA